LISAENNVNIKEKQGVVITLTKDFSICGYTRISVDLEEDRDNTSIENQKAIIEEYVKQKFPGSTVDLYEDRDRSGYTFEQREQYQTMRKKMLSREYDILVVKDLSRFSRRNGQGLVELEYLRDAGIRIIAIGDSIDYPTNDDWMRIQIYFFMNEMPVTDTSKKVRNVIKRRQSDGKWICSVPYGYVLTNTKTMAFQVDAPAAEVVRKIYELYNGGWGYKKIANWLTDQNIPTPRMAEISRIEARGDKTKLKAKQAWSIITVQGILDNDFYIGTLRQGKYTRKKINGSDIKKDESEHLVFERHHEAIVDDKTFELTRQLRLQRTLSNYRGQKKYDNAYSGFLVCGDCGSPMFAMSRSDLKPAYTCGTYHRRGLQGCTSHHIRVDLLDCVVKSYIRRIRDESSEMMEYLQNSIRDEEVTAKSSADAVNALSSQLIRLQEELKATKSQKIRDCLRHPENTEIIEQTYDSLENDLIAHIGGIKSQIVLCADRQSTVVRLNRTALTVMELFDHILEKDSLDRADLGLILESVLVYEDRLEVKLRSDIDAVLRAGSPAGTEFLEALAGQSVVQSAARHKTKSYAVAAVSGSSALALRESPNIVSGGDPLEIYTEKDGEVIFKKYSPVGEISDFAAQICDSLHRNGDSVAVVCDRDSISACAGVPKRELVDKRISAALSAVIDSRKTYVAASAEIPLTEDEDGLCVTVAAPILSEGDVMGCVVFAGKRGSSSPTEVQIKLASAVSGFLGKQMES
jgi:stage V sporulation protein T